MFERFTDRSRRVLVLAQEEARLLERDFIGTEHLLLGLMLVTLGAELTEVRRRVTDSLSSDPSRPSSRARPAHEATSAPPYCGRCGAALAETVRYRSIDAEAASADDGSDRLASRWCTAVVAGRRSGHPREGRPRPATRVPRVRSRGR